MSQRWRVEAEFEPEGGMSDLYEDVLHHLMSLGLDDVEITETDPLPERNVNRMPKTKKGTTHE